MRRRCYATHRKEYPNYGGRGITVCDRWRDSFDNFYADMGLKPDGHSLDRINNDGPYSPNNCRWVTQREQEINKRSNVRFEVFGEMLRADEVAARYGIHADTFRGRIYTRGWTPEKAATHPVRVTKPRHG